jgi:hypothetical protein
MKITPTSRLLFWSGLVVIPLAAFLYTLPQIGISSWSVLSALCGIVIADSLLARRTLGQISVSFPHRIRLSKGCSGDIEVCVKNRRAKTGDLRIGLVFPKEIRSAQPNYHIRLPAETQVSFFSWPCKALKQGRFYLKQILLEMSSPLGLWEARSSAPVHTEICVYPQDVPEYQQARYSSPPIRTARRSLPYPSFSEIPDRASSYPVPSNSPGYRIQHRRQVHMESAIFSGQNSALPFQGMKGSFPDMGDYRFSQSIREIETLLIRHNGGYCLMECEKRMVVTQCSKTGR